MSDRIINLILSSLPNKNKQPTAIQWLTTSAAGGIGSTIKHLSSSEKERFIRALKRETDSSSDAELVQKIRTTISVHELNRLIVICLRETFE
ncbi:unnamed protein product [Caenorhabditis angaria]|uniref:Uncharacterized protein n=1 Tax=Caenorhabditis angaria TaxID=860376 RepID=A0A9P1IE24_9PELO|nr:unnamed protein product [Caenorhabditis angaria]